MNPQVHREYKRLRSVGWDAQAALRAARTSIDFYKRANVVRIRVETDDSPDLSYLDQDMFADVRDSEYERANRDGVVGIIGEYLDPHTGEWIHVDSCWGFIGDDWMDSGYDTDIRQSALDARREAETAPLCPTCGQVVPS